MIRTFSVFVFRFVIILAIQVLVLNNISLYGYANSMIYLILILLLPFETAPAFLIIIAFLSGIVVDIFSNSPGIHASSTVFAAYLRPYVLSVISPRDGYEASTQPTSFYYGLGWFLKYTIAIITIHHFIYFFLEAFNYQNITQTIIRVISSIIFSSIVIVLTQLLVFRK